MENGYAIDTKLKLFDYIVMVDAIASEYFNENGEYNPHIGRINVMRLFYNYCVKKSPFDEKYGHDVVLATDMEEIVADKAFVYAVNDSIENDSNRMELNFGNAYHDAMEIVNAKKASFGQAVEQMSTMATGLVDKLTGVFTKENLDKVTKIAELLGAGKLDVDAITSAYTKLIDERYATAK